MLPVVRNNTHSGTAAFFACASSYAHGLADGDKGFIEQAAGLQLIAFACLCAKHMVTGPDHLLFLLGVIFFLYRMRDVALYVTLFAMGHGITLLFGVLRVYTPIRT